MTRLRRLLAPVLKVARHVDGQDIALVVGLALLAAGLWHLAGWGVAAAVIGALLLLVWSWSLVLAARPPDRRR